MSLNEDGHYNNLENEYYAKLDRGERDWEALQERLVDRYSMSEGMDTVISTLEGMISDINCDCREVGHLDGSETEMYQRVRKALNALEG